MNGRCQNCGEARVSFLPRYPGKNIFQCSSCRAWSFLGQSLDAAKIYTEKYFVGGEYLNYPAEQSIHARNFSRIWNKVSPFLPVRSNLLEVGCAYGHFIHFLEGKVDNAIGIDVSADAILKAQEKYGPHFFLAGSDFSPPWSLQCLAAFDVWEHLNRPFDIFEALVQKLEKGGIFVITTVDSGALLPQLRGEGWRQVHPPTHLHYPNRESISRAFQRMGLEMVEHKHFCYYRSLNTYLSALGLGFLGKTFPVLHRVPVMLDFLDSQIAIGRKRS